MKIVKCSFPIIIALVLTLALPLSASAAPDFTGSYVKEHPHSFSYYDGLNGKTIIFDEYDPNAELYEGETQSNNFYELAYWNPDKDNFISAKSSNAKVARVYDQCELYGSADSDGGYYTAIIEARKKGTTTITVKETIENEPSISYDEYGNEIEKYVPPTHRTYKIKVVVTDKWYAGKLHKYTKVQHPNVYRTSKKLKVRLKNVCKGDKVTIKVGKSKTITKEIKKDKKNTSYTIHFKKQAAGNAVVVRLYDKYGKIVTESYDTVYYASKIKRGLTKKQVKLLPGWGSPDHTDVEGNYTIWWFDDYSKYVKFKKGKVIGWGN